MGLEVSRLGGVKLWRGRKELKVASRKVNGDFEAFVNGVSKESPEVS